MSKLLTVEQLKIGFGSGDSINEVVHGIDFDIEASGETVAILGESGSGKSVSCLALTRLLPTDANCSVSGSIVFDGKDVLSLEDSALRKIRGGGIAYIFQEPSASLNPVFTIGFQIAEAVRLHRPDISDIEGRVIELLELVGIREANLRYRSYPHELSGGMQQRVVIAMALACEPKLLVADEPTTALDVTIQAQILDLLRKLRSQLGMSILLITHNFGIVKGFADRVLVMYQGNIVESGSVETVLSNPQHPYTKGLLSSFPTIHGPKVRLEGIPGNPVNLLELPNGCAFQERCGHFTEGCRQVAPALLAQQDRQVACFNVEQTA